MRFFIPWSITFIALTLLAFVWYKGFESRSKIVDKVQNSQNTSLRWFDHKPKFSVIASRANPTQKKTQTANTKTALKAEKRAIQLLEKQQWYQFNQLLKKDPTWLINAAVSKQLMVQVLQYGGNPELQKSLQQYVALDKNSATSQFFQAVLLHNNGQTAAAIELLFTLKSYYQEEIPVSLINKSIDLASSHYINRLMQSNNLPQLLAFYELLIRFDGANYAYYALKKATAAYQLGDINLALQLIEDHPGSPEVDKLYQQIDSELSKSNPYQFDLTVKNKQYYIHIAIHQNHTAKLLIDTGASISAISRPIFENLSLTPIAITRLQTANGSVQAPIIEVTSFGLPELKIAKMPITVLTFESGLNGLLGMDYLSNFVFYIDPIAEKLHLKPLSEQ